jgi:hypothetical protein
MIKTKKYSSTIAFWLVVIAADLFVYFVLGILQMDYDDSYQGPESEYGSLASMTSLQLLFYFLLQFWNILNVVGLILISRKIFKHLK